MMIFSTGSPVIQQLPQSLVVDEKEIEHGRISIDCIVTGAPLLKVSWLRETENLTFANPSHYRITKSSNSGDRIKSTLTILDPTYEDTGRYACVSTVLNDETGSEKFRARKNVTLTVLGKNCMCM